MAEGGGPTGDNASTGGAGAEGDPQPTGGPAADTVPALILDNAATRAVQPAVSWMTGADTVTLSWSAYRERILAVARGFLGLGVGPGRDVAIVLGNRIEHLIADLAAVHCGAATISVYQTLSDEQLRHVLTDASPAVVIVEDDEAANRITELGWTRADHCHVVAITSNGGTFEWPLLELAGETAPPETGRELDRRLAALRADQPLIYVYTSGTTGPAKGVALTTANILSATDSLIRTGTLDFDYRSISYLPLAHIVERLWSLYVPARLGGHVVCCPDASALAALLTRFRPTYFFGVPRIFAKLRMSAEAVLASPAMAGAGPRIDAERRVLADASRLRRADHSVPAKLISAEALAREGVVRDVRTRLGLDKVSVFACGAAAMTEDLHEFWASLGVDVLLGYGMTENSGVVISDRPGSGAVGSVGLPLPGWEIRIAEDGEILLRGPGNTSGYRDRPAATGELYTSDGWMHTGDIGWLDDAGRLHITGRKKEILVNAAGKNISPAVIEAKLAGRSVIDQVMVFAEARPYAVALITVDPISLARFAVQHGISAMDSEVLVDHPAVRDEVDRLVAEANATLSRPEQIKKYSILPTPWAPQTGELTATMKLRRDVIAKRFGALADSLYGITPSTPDAGFGKSPIHKESDT